MFEKKDKALKLVWRVFKDYKVISCVIAMAVCLISALIFLFVNGWVAIALLFATALCPVIELVSWYIWSIVFSLIVDVKLIRNKAYSVEDVESLSNVGDASFAELFADFTFIFKKKKEEKTEQETPEETPLEQEPETIEVEETTPEAAKDTTESQPEEKPKKTRTRKKKAE